MRALHDYITQRPDAADSIDGIRRWWLPPSLHDESPALVAAAVAQLVADGALRRVVQEDGRVIFSRPFPRASAN